MLTHLLINHYFKLKIKADFNYLKFINYQIINFIKYYLIH